LQKQGLLNITNPSIKREATQADVETVTRHPARFMGNLPGRKKE
jgi:hypothetical protein